MSLAEQFHYSDFTRDNYRLLLRKAKQNYVFRGYTDYHADERFVLWRHDVDFSIHAAYKLAVIEAEEGIASTYFLLPHCEFYNLFEVEVAGKVRDILALGHRIGLHFDNDFYGIKDVATLESKLKFEAGLLSNVFETSVDAFSFHNPDAWMLQQRDATYAGLVNTYAAYFQTSVGYCSDSNGYWRHRRLADVLEQADDARLQVLTHPAWWVDKPASPRDRILRCVQGRAEQTMRKYDSGLELYGRSNVGGK